MIVPLARMLDSEARAAAAACITALQSDLQGIARREAGTRTGPRAVDQVRRRPEKPLCGPGPLGHEAAAGALDLLLGARRPSWAAIVAAWEKWNGARRSNADQEKEPDPDAKACATAERRESEKELLLRDIGAATTNGLRAQVGYVLSHYPDEPSKDS